MNDLKKRKILVVDDEITVCKSIRQAILSDEYEVAMALSGEEALKKSREDYDLVITDLMMPGISGLDLLKSLKETRPETIVIMVTGYPTIKTAVESVKRGAFDYLPKPFTPAELRGLVARAFKKAVSEDLGKGEAEESRIPPGYHYMLGHTWLKVEENNRATVGVVPEFLKAVGIISQLELPKENDTLTQGDACGKITDADQLVHRIWSPASGRVTEVNAQLAADPSLLRRDPFGSGYLFRIETGNLEEDLQGLLLAR
ncbi:MAG: response regulator [Candidatus Aminicenantes bacterium]|nr:response regulator [Candidatus Aminicenantes bacterium]